MEALIGIILGIIFISQNISIIKSDIQSKIIPNKNLGVILVLIPFILSYFIYFGIYDNILLSQYLMQAVIGFVFCFGMYYFKFWGAGDAKYILLLGLIIPSINFLHFLGIIGVVTLIQLLIYFLWFWLGTNLWRKDARSAIFGNLWKTKKQELYHKVQNKEYSQILYYIMRWLNIFIIIFICIRLFRIHLVSWFFGVTNIQFIDLLQFIISSPYGILFIGFIIFGFFCMYIGGKYIFSRLKGSQQYISLWSINAAGFIYLLFEIIADSELFLHNLFIIFTLYLSIYIVLKLFLFAYKLVFISQEEVFLDVKNLEIGMFIDKKFLLKKITPQFCFEENIQSVKENINSFGNSLKKQEITYIQSLYKKIDISHRDIGNTQYVKNNYIKVLYTFPFSINIFIGFLVYILLGKQIFEIIIEYLVSVFSNTL